MLFLSTTKRRVLTTLLFLFFTACNPTCRQWECDEAVTCSRCYDSVRLLISCDNPFNGIGVEIIGTSENLRMYLNVYAYPLLPISPDSQEVIVTITIDGNDCSCNAYLFEGGQRLLVPPEFSEQIIEGLLDEQCVIISIGPYKAEIPHRNFAKSYSLLWQL